jgi:hypothetical protein
VIAKHPLDAVLIRLFVAGQQHDDVARRLPPFALQPDEVGHEHGGARLVVAGAPAVVPALALDERPRIQRPVLAPRGHDVDVRQQQHGTRVRIAAP